MEYYTENNFNGRYVVCKLCSDSDNYEMNMILNNKIDHVLPVSVKRINGEVKLYYDISDMKVFAEYIKTNKVGFEQIKRFLKNISELSKCLENYLLNINHIIIDENCIFINERKKYVEFLYNPFEERDFTEGLKGILSLVLPYINHDDQMTVFLAYGFMEELDGDLVTSGNIMDIVERIEEEIRGKGINNRINEDCIVDNFAEEYKEEKYLCGTESDNKKYKKTKIKEVISERIEELVKKEKRTHEKKKYKERPVYQIEEKR